jgi:hypothetical protein
MGRKWKDHPLTDDPRNLPVGFGLVDEIEFLVERCIDLEETTGAYQQEAEKLMDYVDILAQLNATLDLYFDMKAVVATAAQMLPSRGRLGGLIETPKTAQMKAEVSRLQGKVRRLTELVTQLRKQFWETVLALDSDVYPYDPDHFAQHMYDIERESLEL